MGCNLLGSPEPTRSSSLEQKMRPAELARSSLGISPDAWRDAVEVMGRFEAAVAVAFILDHQETIRSSGGYLRADRQSRGWGLLGLGTRSIDAEAQIRRCITNALSVTIGRPVATFGRPQWRGGKPPRITTASRLLFRVAPKHDGTWRTLGVPRF